MVWLGALHVDVTKPIIFVPHETLNQVNYIDDVPCKNIC